MNGVQKMVMLVLLGSSLVGCGAANLAPRAGAARAVDRRGATLATASGLRPIVAGPGVLHAYSRSNGTAIVVVASAKQDDCGALDRAGARTLPIRADSRLTVELAAGELACVQGARRMGELFWHTHRELPARPTVVTADLAD